MTTDNAPDKKPDSTVETRKSEKFIPWIAQCTQEIIAYIGEENLKSLGIKNARANIYAILEEFEEGRNG